MITHNKEKVIVEHDVVGEGDDQAVLHLRPTRHR